MKPVIYKFNLSTRAIESERFEGKIMRGNTVALAEIEDKLEGKWSFSKCETIFLGAKIPNSLVEIKEMEIKDRVYSLMQRFTFMIYMCFLCYY